MSIYTNIEEYATLYFGTLLVLTGLIGNLLNVCVFWTYEFQNSSIFLLLVSSCASALYLIGSLLTRVLFIGFHIHSLGSSLIWCKIRLHVSQAAWFISISCICYAVIDRFFLSSRHVKWRRQSQLFRTRRNTGLIAIIWLVHALPILMFREEAFYDHGRLRCNSLSVPHFRRYVAYFVLPILATTVPVSFLTIFGFLTYRNLSLLTSIKHRQRVQRPLTSMILFQTAFIVMASTPLAVNYMYAALTSSTAKSPRRLDIEGFTLDITVVLYGLPHVASFFNYCFSSSLYRQQLKKLLRLSFHRSDIRLTQMNLLNIKQKHLTAAP